MDDKYKNKTIKNRNKGIERKEQIHVNCRTKEKEKSIKK